MKRFLAALMCVITLILMIPTAGAEFTGDDKIVIVLDPGHGGVNVGTARNGVGEKVMTFKLANLIKARLEENGNFIVHMTRDGDYDLPLASRGIYANSVNADVLVSLHFDGSTSKGDRGVSVITSVLSEYEMTELARMVCNSFSEKTGIPIKGVIQRKDNEGYYWNAEKQWDCQDSSLGILSDYYGIPTWCCKFGIGSILIEHGFFTNDSDAAIIFAEGTLEKMADADAEAIINYYTNHTHTYTETATRDFPSNCMFQGKQSQKCTICGHRKNVSYIDAAPDAHYWINEKSKSPTCGTDGYVSRQCWITLNLNKKDVPCENHEEIKYISAQPHDYEQTGYREMSHAVDGYTQYTCKNCGSTFKDIVKAEGHNWQIVDQIQPNCTQVGATEYYCDICEESYTETVAALGHSIILVEEKAPTCTEEGYKKTYCTACNQNLEETFSATGHDLTVEIISLSSCTVDGEKHTVCNTCGFEEIAIDPKTGHTMELAEEVKATCESAGYKSYKCKDCDHTEREEFIATGHKFSTEITAEASLFVQGAKLTSCANCGEQYREVIPSAWDNPVTKAVFFGGSALVIALICTAVILYLKKKDKKENDKSSPEPEMVAAAEKIAEETEPEKTEEAAESAEKESSEESAEETAEETVEEAAEEAVEETVE